MRQQSGRDCKICNRAGYPEATVEVTKSKAALEEVRVRLRKRRAADHACRQAEPRSMDKQLEAAATARFFAQGQERSSCPDDKNRTAMVSLISPPMWPE